MSPTSAMSSPATWATPRRVMASVWRCATCGPVRRCLTRRSMPSSCPWGQPRAAYDDAVPWLADELAFLRRADQAGVPLFGVCFGAQALARAVGGQVRPAREPEIGWYEIDTTAPQLIEAGPWLQWHFDTLTPPPGAVRLARTTVGVQAYRLRRQIGVQFHPEVTPAIVEAWISSSGARLTERDIDVAALAAETRARVPEARAGAHRLFDRVVEELAVGQPRSPGRHRDCRP